MKFAPVVLVVPCLLVAQTNPVIDAYQRGAEIANQQAAIAVDCLNHPSCVAALREAQAQKDAAKGE